MNETSDASLKKQLLEREKQRLMDELPHLYGWPWYPWAKEFFLSANRINLMCAANQISKSSTQIRKCLDWATNQPKWPKLWGRSPNQFWYLYPSKDVATAEFETKWLPEFMPRGIQKNSIYYGWTAEYDGKHIKAIHFNSGVRIYFKTYAQDPKTLQSGSVYAIFCDEELPEHLYDELKFRLAGTRGYFHMVFTATLGQELWWRAMEAIGTDVEVFPQAFKQTISMYDCLLYEDNTVSPWNVDRIREEEASCKSQAEINRRIHGRFVKEDGRKYHGFDPVKHYVKPFDIPKDWIKLVGVDIGSGGQNNHPSAIVFLATNPGYTKGYIYKGWRGDGIQTTSGDVYEKFLELKGDTESFMRKVYDYSAADFGTITGRLGDSWSRANKSHELGEDIINTLLKNDALFVFDTDELRKLGTEMLTLQRSTPKTKAKDDFCDGMRYPVVEVPWNFPVITKSSNKEEQENLAKAPQTKEEWDEYYMQQRRAGFYDPNRKAKTNWEQSVESDIAEWNEQYGN